MLQQHFSGDAQPQQTPIYSTGGMQQRIILQQQPITVVHTSHQQISGSPVTAAIISPESGNILQQQQQAMPVSAVFIPSPGQVTSPQQPFSVGSVQQQMHQNIQGFSSPPTSLYLVTQPQQESSNTNISVARIGISNGQNAVGELIDTGSTGFIGGNNRKTPDPTSGFIKPDTSPAATQEQQVSSLLTILKECKFSIEFQNTATSNIDTFLL